MFSPQSAGVKNVTLSMQPSFFCCSYNPTTPDEANIKVTLTGIVMTMPTPTPTPTVEPTATPTPTFTPDLTVTPTPAITFTPSPTPMPVPITVFPPPPTPQANSVSPATPEGQADRLMEQGIALYQRGALQEALTPFQAAQTIYHELANPKKEANALNWLGLTSTSLRDFPRAIEAFQQALTLSRESGDRVNAGRMVSNLALVYAQQGQDALAVKYFQDALTMARESGDSAIQQNILRNIGVIAARQPQAAEAIAVYQQIAAIYHQTGDARNEAEMLKKMGEIALQQGDYAAAVTYYDQSLNRLRNLDAHIGQVLALLEQGDVYAKDGLNDDAIEAYRRAMGIIHDAGVSDMTLPVAQKAIYARTMAAAKTVAARDPEKARALTKQADAFLQDREPAAPSTPTPIPGYMIKREQPTPTPIPTPTPLPPTISQPLSLASPSQKPIAAPTNTPVLTATPTATPAIRPAVTPVKPYVPAEPATRTLWQKAEDYKLRADIYYKNREYNDALKIITCEIPLRHQLTDRDGLLNALERKLKILQASKAPLSEQAAVISTMADLLMLSGQDEAAISALTQFIDQCQSGKPAPQIVDAWNRLGLLQLRQGRFAEAEQAFIQADKISNRLSKKQRTPALLAKTANNQGLLWYLLGEYPKAAAAFQTALQLMQAAKDAYGTAVVCNQLALVAYQTAQQQASQGQLEKAQQTYSQALVLFRRALAIVEQIGDRAAQGTILNNLGLTSARMLAFYWRAGEAAGAEGNAVQASGYYQAAWQGYQQAYSAYQDALQIIRAAGGRAGESATLHNLGQLYATINLDAQALESLAQALAIEQAIGNRIDAARTLGEIGWLYERQGRFEQALDYYQQAIAGQEQLRTAARIEEFKISLAAQAFDVYQRAIVLLMRMQRPEEAFSLAERAHDRTLLDLLGNTRIPIRSGVDQDVLRQEQTVRTELVNLNMRLSQELRKPIATDNTRTIDSLKAEITQKQADYEQLLIRIKALNPAYASLISVNPLPLTDLQKTLDDQTTLLSYVVTPGETIAFVITRDAFESFEIPVREAELADAIKMARLTNAGSSAAVLRSLQQLYTWLITPVEPALKTKFVGIIPHGVLSYLPFEALIQGTASADNSDDFRRQRYFGDEHLLFSLPSASVLQFMQLKQKLNDGKLLVMAYQGYPPLRYAEQEARDIAGIRATDLLLGKQATKAALQARANQYSILHLSAHGELNQISSLFSGLQLADGTLAIQEIFGLDLTHVNLVVLSACHTQLATRLGAQNSGREIIALNRALLYAGVPSVAASLWNVNDKATHDLMIAFYTFLTQGLSPAESLQQARMEIRKTYPHPHYWAAFVLTGDPGTRQATAVTDVAASKEK
jgi:CHAT domain-containing protein